MTELVVAYAPWRVRINDTEDTLAHPWVRNYVPHPMRNEGWMYIDVDEALRAKARDGVHLCRELAAAHRDVARLLGRRHDGVGLAVLERGHDAVADQLQFGALAAQFHRAVAVADAGRRTAAGTA